MCNGLQYCSHMSKDLQLNVRYYAIVTDYVGVVDEMVRFFCMVGSSRVVWWCCVMFSPKVVTIQGKCRKR